jgi:hypothetical protein
MTKRSIVNINNEEVMKSTTTTATKKYGTENQTTEYEQKITRALELQDTINPAKKELEEIKQYFLNLFKEAPVKTEQRLATAVGTVILKITNSYSIAELAVPRLKDIFKKQYKIFVNEKVSFSPTPAMRKLLEDGDYEHKDELREAVIIKTSPSVVFEPIATVATEKAKKGAGK